MLLVFGNYFESTVDVGSIDAEGDIRLHKAARVELSGVPDPDDPQPQEVTDLSSSAGQFRWAGFLAQDAMLIIDGIYPDGIDALLYSSELIATAISVVPASQRGVERSWEALSTFAPAVAYVTTPDSSPLAAAEALLHAARAVVEEAEGEVDRMGPRIREASVALGLGEGGGRDRPAFGEVFASLPRHTSGVRSVVFSPDGSMLASGSDNTVKLWRMPSREEITTLTMPGSRGYAAFLPDGATLATADGSVVMMWDVRTREVLARVGTHLSISAMALSPDGRTLATAGWDDTVKLWDLPSEEELATLEGFTFSVNCVEFSPDGATLAVSSYRPNTLSLWDVDSGQKIAALRGHTDTVYFVDFSPDGQTLASASDDTTVRLWDVHSGQELAVLHGHTDIAFAVAFSPDGRMLVSTSRDNTIRLWDAHTRREVATLYERTNIGFSVAFSPDGNTLAVGGQDRTVKFRSVAPWNWMP
jgi:uncharacterized protein with WD repeat